MPSRKPQPLRSRKLLVAAIGIATVSYVAVACGTSPTSGNLPAGRGSSGTSEDDPIIPPTSGNLPSPQPIDAGECVEDEPSDAGSDAGADAGDAGSDADAGRPRCPK